MAYIDDTISLIGTEPTTQADADAFEAMLTKRAAEMEAQRRAAVKAQTEDHPWKAARDHA